MLSAYLYNTSRNQLTPLDSAGLLASAPKDHAPHPDGDKNGGKNGGKNGKLSSGPAQCHADEFVWVDITAPTDDDYDLLRQRFELHHLVIEDIKGQEGRPKLHDYHDYLYLIFHAVRLDANPDEAGAQRAGAGRFALHLDEIDCLAGHDYVVTVHAGPVEPLEDLRDRWQRRPELMQAGAAHLLYEILDAVLDDYFPLLDALDERIDEFEDRLFMSFREGLSADIFALKRCLLEIRRVAAPTRDVVNTLLRHDAENGGQNFAYFQDLYDHTVRIVDMIDTFRDLLSGALDAYLAIQSNRMNEIMKTLTAASIILLVPSMIAGVYGMNFDDLPKAHGFWGAVTIMAALIVGLSAYFKRKGWL